MSVHTRGCLCFRIADLAGLSCAMSPCCPMLLYLRRPAGSRRGKSGPSVSGGRQTMTNSHITHVPG